MPHSYTDPTFTPTADELAEKRRRVVALCTREGLDALLLTHEASVGWITGGGMTRVSIGGADALATVLVTRAGEAHVLADAIESPRLAAEEMPDQGVHMHVYPWEQGRETDRAAAIRRIVGDGAVGADAPIAGVAARVLADAVRDLRSSLRDGDVARYRWLAETTATILEAAARAVRPGMTEHAIAASYTGPLNALGIEIPVYLVAADDRLQRFRHPLPTDNIARQHVLLVAGATRWGLHASMSRAVHFGPLPDDLRHRQEVCAAVDVAFIAATKEGATAAEIFAAGADAYAAGGFPGEWRLHHQGGAAGYNGREWVVTPHGTERVVARQAFAYNPSVTGTKSEDTFVLGADGTPDFLSVTGKWPAVPRTKGRYPRPAILEQ